MPRLRISAWKYVRCRPVSAAALVMFQSLRSSAATHSAARADRTSAPALFVDGYGVRLAAANLGGFLR